MEPRKLLSKGQMHTRQLHKGVMVLRFNEVEAGAKE